MKALVLGCRGQLGRALVPALEAAGRQVIGVDREEVDISDSGALAALVREVAPELLLNCAAYTAVDQAEEEPDAAFAVNAGAVATLAELADELDARLIQISTDYVFDGRGRQPYREDDPVNPASVYGRSKLAGEQAALAARRRLVVRTAWLYGPGEANFVAAILRQVHRGVSELRVVGDQWGSPTSAGDLATALVDLVIVEAEGVVHAVNSGVVTWCGFAAEIVRLLGAGIPVVPITTDEAARRAPRPAWSVLGTGRLENLIGRPMAPWEDALARHLRVQSGLSASR